MFSGLKDKILIDFNKNKEQMNKLNQKIDKLDC